MGTTSSTSQQHQLRNALHQHAETIIKLQNVYQCFAAQGNGNGEEYLVKKFTELATAAPSSSPTTTSSQKDEFQIPEAAKDKVFVIFLIYSYSHHHCYIYCYEQYCCDY